VRLREGQSLVPAATKHAICEQFQQINVLLILVSVAVLRNREAIGDAVLLRSDLLYRASTFSRIFALAICQPAAVIAAIEP
jgi:hypothetical protein